MRLELGGAEVLDAGVAHEGDDRRIGTQLFGQPQRPDDVGPGGCAEL